MCAKRRFEMLALVTLTAMYTIRGLLDFLVERDPDAINRLCDLRGLGGRGKAAKCESLARSYRNKHEQFFEEMRKEDLVALLNDPTDIDGEEFYLPSANSYPKAKLIRFALRIFRDEDPPRQFERLADEEEEETEDEYDEGAYDEETDEGDGATVDADLSSLAEVDLLGAVSASAARRSPKLLEWIAPAAGTPTAKLTRLVSQAHGNTLLRNILEASWPIEVPDGAGPALATLRVSAVRRAPTLVEWVARLTRVPFEDVMQAVQDAGGNTRLQSLFPALTSAAARREDDRSAKPASGGDRLVGGRWEILRTLGEGGFGYVFEARDTRRGDDRRVVLKVARDATAAGLLHKEMRIGEHLRHQNICTYLFIDEDPSVGVFVILDHGGRSLDQIIEECGSLPQEAVVDVTMQLARALDYVHKRNVLHQDMKPQNVLIQEARDGWDVRLTDFGVSVLGRTGLRTDGAKTVLASEIVGYTWPYAAPEQLQGRAKRASDQYSLALVACSMLEGQVFQHRYDWRPFSQLSAAQNRAFMRALSPDPEQRFDSCEDFARALGALS
jgi:hypothetical protein